jgi:hypothetical protein
VRRRARGGLRLLGGRRLDDAEHDVAGLLAGLDARPPRPRFADRRDLGGPKVVDEQLNGGRFRPIQRRRRRGRSPRAEAAGRMRVSASSEPSGTAAASSNVKAGEGRRLPSTEMAGSSSRTRRWCRAAVLPPSPRPPQAPYSTRAPRRSRRSGTSGRRRGRTRRPSRRAASRRLRSDRGPSSRMRRAPRNRVPRR